jgi:NTP pyrophosphatase (non-canonical NTP hydrolase)
MAFDYNAEVQAKIQHIIKEYRMNQAIIAAGNLITEVSHAASLKAGWWHDLKTGELIEPNIGEKLMLIVSEVSEAMEGARKNLQDDKLPHRKMIEVELADAVIRIGDLCGRLNLDLGGAIAEKLEFNASREDHKIENRKKENGKRF